MTLTQWGISPWFFNKLQVWRHYYVRFLRRWFANILYIKEESQNLQYIDKWQVKVPTYVRDGNYNRERQTCKEITSVYSDLLSQELWRRLLNKYYIYCLPLVRNKDWKKIQILQPQKGLEMESEESILKKL